MCALHAFLSLLMYQSRDYTNQDRFRHLLIDILYRSEIAWIWYYWIWNCLFDITILYIISEPRVKKKTHSRDRKLPIALIC